MTGRLQGKSSVSTGAASGIGKATAQVFADEGAGLVLTDIQPKPLDAVAADLREQGAEAVTVVGDVSKEDDTRAMITAAVDACERVDHVVANADIILVDGGYVPQSWRRQGSR